MNCVSSNMTLFHSLFVFELAFIYEYLMFRRNAYKFQPCSCVGITLSVLVHALPYFSLVR